jgi:hypothetical protein
MVKDFSGDSPEEKTGLHKLLLPALGLSVFSAWLITVMFQLLLIDIAKTFSINVGIAGQVASITL